MTLDPILHIGKSKIELGLLGIRRIVYEVLINQLHANEIEGLICFRAVVPKTGFTVTIGYKHHIKLNNP